MRHRLLPGTFLRFFSDRRSSQSPGLCLVSSPSLYQHGQPMFRPRLCHCPGYQWQHLDLALFRLQFWTICGIYETSAFPF
ncbi:hypothetical protein DTO006G1_2696 [Penicillium roqueforti]|uniref:uncharacterized protein n=1 Tax=Penicillium roqueforti TaxID=5082 RepID=UPI00190A3E6B|nr:uncharacterized protein LCP9604111_1696 [Penicillium roqueforti]KAF9251700.1 hypothetical protein LCP9604111_1696 [Penicillium roqueforti]KAI1836487.1 hypothetical protein CBS147337_2714 [Penicillium roqueforti]KAI2685375.1 hypothetical protein LCP963914a_4702 [Penicillium roqueforti]KAI2690266.1 hypothetical protein CBS147355_717 [Penicillium roqueforti]KAI2695170.1 hypothetical protein CBS147372_9298 [Penicillium roqueforti]